MKKILLSAVLFTCLALIACKNKNQPAPAKDPKQLEADSLEKKVLEEHDIAMPRSMKIPKLKKEIKKQIDSISRLPAKVQEAAAGLKTKLETLMNDLDYAEFAMDKWMIEFKIDSARNNLEQRIRYLADEKLKVGKVKEDILNGLARADSLLKAKL